MSEQEIFDKLVEIVSESLDDENLKSKVTMETNIFTDLSLSSISFIYLALSIEDTFNVKINNDDVRNNQLVKDWVKYIKERTK